jgi:anti-sigma factor RsiW
MMKPITEDDLHAFVDDNLEVERREQVEKYLASNRDALARVAAYRNQASALRSALDPIAAEAIPTRLDLRHITPTARKSRQTSQWRFAAAAVILLAVGAGGGWFTRGFYTEQLGGISTLAAEASASYRTFAADRVRPVEFRSDERDTLRDIARSVTGTPEVLPDLTAVGYRLMGGRMVPTVHGPAMMLMYDNDQGSRLVMLSRRMAVDRDSSMKSAHDDGVGSWTWARSGIGYSLVGIKSMGELRAIADRAKEEIEL